MQSLVRVLPALGPDEEVDVDNAGTRPQQLLEQHLAHEAGATGDEHRLACVEVTDGRVDGLRRFHR